MLDVLDRRSLEVHDHILAGQLVVLAWCYHTMIEQLSDEEYLKLPSNFFNVEANLTRLANAMWEEHGEVAYQWRLADIARVVGASAN